MIFEIPSFKVFSNFKNYVFNNLALSQTETCRPSPPPSKSGQKNVLSQKICNVLKRLQKKSLFFHSTKCLFQVSETQRFLRTCFRNVDQWYTITSWLKVFKQKAPGGRAPLTQFFSNFGSNFACNQIKRSFKKFQEETIEK